ncbi:hypothetical protein ES707_17585 [subsurface metagenome]
MVSTELQYKSFWLLTKVACDTLASTSLLLYVMDFLKTKELDLKRKLLLWLPLLFAVAFLFTNYLHQMVFTSLRVDPRNAYDPLLIEARVSQATFVRNQKLLYWSSVETIPRV